MAGKQLGKLRQWAGEVISSREKTVVTDEFRELENDIELRRQGLWRLHLASEGFRNHISKKKDSEATDETEKLLPIEALGIVMIKHGEEFGDDSVFGTSLMNFGRAHCKIAAIQEAFGMDFQATYLTSITRMEDEIKEYQAQRKKLESRRLTLDAAANKLEKVNNSKKPKDKDRDEAEDEYAQALARYEEVSEDVRARMYAIQENEVAQLRDLTDLLNLEFRFVESYLEVLKSLKDEWVTEDSIRRMEQSKPKHQNIRPPDSAFASVRSTKSIKRPKAEEVAEPESSGDDDSPRARTLSSSKRAPEPGSKNTSRPPSPSSRKRSNSSATVNSTKEKADKSGRRKSVAGWASNAVNSVTGRGKKDKETFAALRDTDGEDSDEDDQAYSRPPSAMSSSSRKSQHRKSKGSVSLPTLSPKPSLRARKSIRDAPDVKGAFKFVVALHDFAAGSTDELSFKAGDHIAVVNEVLDGWWMGEINGRRGLFPTTYTEVVASNASRPTLPQRPSASARALAYATNTSLEGSPKSSSLGSLEIQEDLASDAEGHPFGDHNVAFRSNLAAPIRSPGIGQFWPDSASSAGEDDDEEQLVPQRQSFEEVSTSVSHTGSLAVPPVPPRRATTSDFRKPAPPPPPPRRSPNIAAAALNNPPAIPSRPPTSQSRSSHSSSASLVALTTTPALRELGSRSKEDGLTYSPFDSPRDQGGCREFKQNPFKPKGFCSTCYQMHT